MAGIASLFIVLVCEVFSRDKVKFKVLWLEFEGASGKVVLWVFCFLAITLAIYMLWDKTFTGPAGTTYKQGRAMTESSSSIHETPNSIWSGRAARAVVLSTVIAAHRSTSR